MALLYDYCACCGRRIEIGRGEVSFNTHKDGEALSFCRRCIEVVVVDEITEFKPQEGKEHG